MKVAGHGLSPSEVKLTPKILKIRAKQGIKSVRGSLVQKTKSTNALSFVEEMRLRIGLLMFGVDVLTALGL